MCPSCKDFYHIDLTCEEFLALPPEKRGEDHVAMQHFLQIADGLGMKRCYQCGFMVELRDGCVHMRCHCRYEFCYTCGSKW